MQAINYLQFNGDAKKAFDYYKNVLGSHSSTYVKFGDMPSDSNFPLSEAESDMMMEGAVHFHNNILMLSDVLPSMQSNGQPIQSGSQLIISLIDASKDQLESIFTAFSEQATVIIPLGAFPWSSCFGLLIDPFGVTWKFNSDASKFLASFHSV